MINGFNWHQVPKLNLELAGLICLHFTNNTEDDYQELIELIFPLSEQDAINQLCLVKNQIDSMVKGQLLLFTTTAE